MSFDYVYLPASDPIVTTTLLLLHGTGGNEHDLIDIGKSLLPGAAILSPRGKVSENGLNRWFRRFTEGVFDEDSIRSESSDLALFLKHIYQVEGINPDLVIAIGYSNGANIGASLLLLHPEVLSGLVMWRGMYPIEPTAQVLTGKSVLMINGTKDPMAPLTSVEKLATVFSRLGAKTDLELLETGHQLTQRDFELTKSWGSQFSYPVHENQ